MKHLKAPTTILFICLFCIILLTAEDRPAYAYLDPGVGNTIIYGLISGFFALTFAARGVYYKVRSAFRAKGKIGERPNGAEKPPIAVYSRGRRDGMMFRAVIENILKRGRRVLYISSELEDSLLGLETEGFQARYLEPGTGADNKMLCGANTVLSAAPPPWGDCADTPPEVLAFLPDSLNINELEAADSVLQSQKVIFRPSQKTAEASAPGDVFSGLIWLDRPPLADISAIFAPTALLACGSEPGSAFPRLAVETIIPLLSRHGLRSILRPPLNGIGSKELSDALEEHFKGTDVIVDRSGDPAAHLNQVSAILSDDQGYGLTLALIGAKPLFIIDNGDVPANEYMSSGLATILPYDELASLPEHLQAAMTAPAAQGKIGALRAAYSTFPGHPAASVVADWLLKDRTAKKAA